MVSVVVKFEIAFGREQNFESSLSRVAAAMLATSFCTKCDWYKSVQSKGVYMLVSEWSRGDEFRSFWGSESHRNASGWGAKSIVASRPRDEYFERIPIDA